MAACIVSYLSYLREAVAVAVAAAVAACLGEVEGNLRFCETFVHMAFMLLHVPLRT